MPSDNQKEHLKCPNCGNTDLSMFTYWDQPYAIRHVKEFEDGVLWISSDFEVEYDGNEKCGFHCEKCHDNFDKPKDLKVDFS